MNANAMGEHGAVAGQTQNGELKEDFVGFVDETQDERVFHGDLQTQPVVWVLFGRVGSEGGMNGGGRSGGGFGGIGKRRNSGRGFGGVVGKT